jgi:phosphatidylserine/phosphatidylglycerophosphate/cardiolipin synthase-like enzyme
MRLHVRAIIRDGTRAFVGSQSLRTDELQNRREVGLLISNPSVTRKIMQVFEADWADAAKKGEADEAKAPQEAKGDAKDAKAQDAKEGGKGEPKKASA